MMRAASPGHLVSPHQSFGLPMPSSSADVLERRRRALFQGNRKPHERTPDRYTLQPGPMPSERRQRLSKRPPSSLLASSSHDTAPSPDDITARLYRQRFRQRCQAAMAREKSRSSVIAGIRGPSLQKTSSDSDDDEVMPLNSDDLSSSEVEDDGKADDWQYEDAELVRRVMVAEYRHLLHNREHSGKRELGWLGADEVAWLEEELQREEQLGDDSEQAEYYDEEQELYEQYQHAMQQEQTTREEDEFGDLDDAVFEEVVEDRMDLS